MQPVGARETERPLARGLNGHSRGTALAGSTPPGAPPRSVRSYGAWIWASACRPSAPSMPSWTGTAWSAPPAEHATKPRAPVSLSPCIPMSSGAPTTRVSSCSPTGAIAIRSPSPTSPAGIRCVAATRQNYAFTVFERVFKEFGLPRAIRTDNGVPFASCSTFFGLSTQNQPQLRLRRPTGRHPK